MRLRSIHAGFRTLKEGLGDRTRSLEELQAVLNSAAERNIGTDDVRLLIVKLLRKHHELMKAVPKAHGSIAPDTKALWKAIPLEIQQAVAKALGVDERVVGTNVTAGGSMLNRGI